MRSLASPLPLAGRVDSQKASGGAPVRRLLLAALILLPACETQSAPPAPAAQTDGRGQTGLEVIPLTITTASGATHRFRVEVARTGQQQNRGLMFRERLADDAGMLFPTAQPETRGFYMKNTPEPLDMIFIRQDGTIARIAEETTPFSLETISSAEPVIAVLELRGGRAAELGVSEGDGVSWAGGPGVR